MVKFVSEKVKEATLHLRYTTQKPADNAKVYFKYKDIAKVVGLKYHHVREICQQALPRV